MAYLERVFRGDLKASHYSIEHDLSLFIWPPRLIVQRISVPLRIRCLLYNTTSNKYSSTYFRKKPQISVEISQNHSPFQHLFAVFFRKSVDKYLFAVFWKSAKKKYWRKKPRISKSANKKTAYKEDGL